MKKKKLIVITGIDGSGKTTLIKEVVQQITNARVVSIWDMLKHHEDHVRKIFANQHAIHDYLKILHGPGRTFFMLHPLHQALTQGLHSPEEILLVDGYWYKYLAGEIIYGLDPQMASLLAATFPKPDHVFFLKVNPEVIVSRKNSISGYESEYNQVSPESGYVNFQTKVQIQIDKFLVGTALTVLDGSDDLSKNCQQVLSLLKPLAHMTTQNTQSVLA